MNTVGNGATNNASGQNVDWRMHVVHHATAGDKSGPEDGQDRQESAKASSHAGLSVNGLVINVIVRIAHLDVTTLRRDTKLAVQEEHEEHRVDK